MIASIEPTLLQTKLQKIMNDSYHIHVTKFDNYHIETITNKQNEIDEIKLRQRVGLTPIEDLGIESNAIDGNIINNVLQKPLLVEIKEVRNLSQPYQRGTEKISSKDEQDREKKRMKKQKNTTYQFKAHDGKRLLKIILLFQDQEQVVKGINEYNKFILYDAYMSPSEPNTFVIDSAEQIEQVFNDKYSPKVQEEFQLITGLPIKYTNAPRFVFLNEKAAEEGEKQRQEQEDEFADVFKEFDVPDLTSSERTYIKRFEQLGFWRKKFI